MMKNNILSLIYICLLVSVISAKQIYLPDLRRAQGLAVGENRIYISTGTTVEIYSMPEFKRIKKFGEKGEGPGEFKTNWDNRGLILDVRTGRVVVCSLGKVSWFTDDGRLLREVKAPSERFRMPVGEHYVGLGFVTEDAIGYQTLNIYDRKFRMCREIARKKHWRQRNQKIDPTDLLSPRFRIYEKRVYVEDHEGNIHIFDEDGRKLFSTDMKYQPVTISEAQKQGFHEYFKIHPAYKDLYARLKPLLQFPEYFPPIKFYDVADSKIYVFTHLEKGGKQELFIFTLNGQLQKKIYLSIPKILPHSMAHQRMTKVKNDRLYQLIEDENADTWEIYITEIK